MASALTTTLSNKYISLAKTLPAQLQRFLARYPPDAILSADQRGLPQTGYQLDSKNPFHQLKFLPTGRWHNPVYSRRRQADLVKMARKHGVEELLPHTVKRTDVKLAKRVKLGWRGKGTGEGQQVKGHIHERQLAAKYVFPVRGGGEDGALRSFVRLACADFVTAQDGQEKRGYAQDAGARQGMEGGKSQLSLALQICTNCPRRLVGRTGPSGRNKLPQGHGGYFSTVQLPRQNVHHHRNAPFKHKSLRRSFLEEALPREA